MRNFVRMVILVLVLVLVIGQTPAEARTLWALHQRATSLEAQGNINEAMPLWFQLAEGYARIGNWTNAAIFWKRLGHALEERGQREEAVRAYENQAFFWTKAGHPSWGIEDLARADALRSTIRLFAARPDVGPPPANLELFEPRSGAYLGVYSELDPAVRTFPALGADAYGRPHAAYIVYIPWRHRYADTNSWIPKLWFERAKAAGAAIQVKWMPDRGLDDVRDDAYLREFARELNNTGIPIFLRFAGEMNGDWVPWHGNPAQYIEKWRLVARVIRQEAPNVALVWAPNHSPDDKVDAYYPGDEYVDWVGISLYQDYYSSGLAAHKADRELALDKIRAIYDRYSSRKPIMIAEWAAANFEYTFNTDVSRWGAMQIDSFYRSLPMLFPRVKAVFYFSVDQRSTPNPYHPTAIWSNYLLTGNPTVNRAYRQATSGPFFHERVAPTGEKAAPFKYVELRDFTNVSAQESLSTFVNIHDPFISRVEYQLEGTSPVVRTEFPYEFSVNLTNWAGKTVRLDIRAYNSNGQLEASRQFRLVVGDGRPAATFRDLNGHWSQSQVARLSSYGIVGGYPDGTFRPDAAISREEFVKLAVAALGLPLGEPAAVPSFTDVLSSRWSAPYIEAAVLAGILVPVEYQAGRFQPSTAITRLEMAVILVRALGLWKEAEFGTHSVPFSDANLIPQNRRGYVALSAARGLMGGMPDGRFAGGESATRAQAAVVIARFIEGK